MFVNFEITADDVKKNFGTTIPSTVQVHEIIDVAFEKVYKEVDTWLWSIGTFKAFANHISG